MFDTFQTPTTSSTREMNHEIEVYCILEGLDPLLVISDVENERKEQKRKREWVAKINQFKKRMDCAFSR